MRVDELVVQVQLCQKCEECPYRAIAEAAQELSDAEDDDSDEWGYRVDDARKRLSAALAVLQEVPK